MKPTQRGFTLVELMIVVAIIGILAALAIPSFSEYTIRAQVTEGMSLVSVARSRVAEFFSQTGMAPANRTEAGMTANATDTSGKFVTQVDVTNGVVTVTFGNKASAQISGKTLSMTPYQTPDGSVVWRCSVASAPAGANLLGTGSAQVAAYAADTLSAVSSGRFLPRNCRTSG